MFKYSNNDSTAINSYLDRFIADMVITGNSGLKKAMLVEGEHLGEILRNEVGVEQLANIAKICEVVVCCRVTPKQKADVVALVKNKLGKITLSIGDGANDVNMIQEAHIGVGLYGNEGMRAVQSSDYALPEFQYLWRLLLVHGRWNYLRVSEMILYFFYKNIIFTIPQFYYAFFCAFSGQSFFGQNYVSLYNLAFTSIPLIVKALFEQDINYLVKSDLGVKSEYLPDGFVENPVMKRLYPTFYYLGQRNTIFNSRNFAIWYFEGLLAGLIITIWSIFCMENTILSGSGTFPNYDMTSLVAFSSVITVATIKLATHTRFWNLWFFILLVLTSFAIYILWMFVSNISLFWSELAFSVIVYFQTGLTYFVVGFCLCLLLSVDGISLYLRDNVTDWRVGLVRETLSNNPDYIKHHEFKLT